MSQEDVKQASVTAKQSEMADVTATTTGAAGATAFNSAESSNPTSTSNANESGDAATSGSQDDSKELADDEKSNQRIRSTVWQCQNCKLFNSNDSWRCAACFSIRKVQKNEFEGQIPSQMRGLLKREPGVGFEYVNDLKVVDPGPGEVLVKSFRVGICGSDLILYDWTKKASLIAKTPFTPGHETAGLVVKTGEKTGLKVGQRVAIENHFFCGDCYQCKHKRKDICANMSQFGHGKGTIYGGMSEYFIVKAEYCYRLRKRDTTWRDAALLEPLGVALNACDQAEVRSNVEDSILVIGCGTIGLLAVGVCKAYKVRRVFCLDIVDWKLGIATKYGADTTILMGASGPAASEASEATAEAGAVATSGGSKDGPRRLNVKDFEQLYEVIMRETNGVGIGRIIECSGHSKTISNMFKLLRKGGIVVLVGLPKEPLQFDDPMPDLVFKSLTIRSIHGRRIFDTWKRAEELVAKKQINLDHVVTQEMPLTNFEEGYKLLKGGKALKILFDPNK